MTLAGSFLDDPVKGRYKNLGSSIVHTCHKMSPTGFGTMGVFDFAPDADLYAVESYSIPQVSSEMAESYFVMWRSTHDPKYRQWGEEMLRVIIKTFCTTQDDTSCQMTNLNLTDISSVRLPLALQVG